MDVETVILCMETDAARGFFHNPMSGFVSFASMEVDGNIPLLEIGE